MNTGFYRVHLLALSMCVLGHAASELQAVENLADNPTFEIGTAGWVNIGPCTISTSDISHSGERSVLVSERTADWHGIGQSLFGKLRERKTYLLGAWVRLAGATEDAVEITVVQEDSEGTHYFHPKRSTVYDDRWVFVSGMFTLAPVGQLKSLAVQFEGPAGGVDFYIDDVQVVEVNWKTEANKRIEQIRKRDARIQVLSPTGTPVADAKVHIRQQRHLFGFGCSIDSNLVSNPEYSKYFTKFFEWAVPDAALKWYVNEPERGDVTYANADQIYEFCAANDIKLRGHNIFWSGTDFVPPWARTLPKDELEQAVRNRLDSVMGHFKGKISHWEVNNEMMDGSFYQNNLGEVDGVPVRVWMFQQAAELDPDAELFINDYGPIGYGNRIPEFMAHVRELRGAGAPIHGIGLQGHCPGSFNRGMVLSRFDSIAELDLPIWITEFDVEQPDEAQRARDFEDFYRIAFSHPAVQGVLMYGFWENAQWRLNSYIVNTSWTLNEAGRRYEALMDEWTTNLRATTDENGYVSFRGFHGTYEIAVEGADGQSTSEIVEITKGDTTVALTVQFGS